MTKDISYFSSTQNPNHFPSPYSHDVPFVAENYLWLSNRISKEFLIVLPLAETWFFVQMLVCRPFQAGRVPMLFQAQECS